jgi:hypothetical protein
MEIKKFDDIRYEIARLDEKMQLQEKSIKQKFHGLFIQTHPLTIAAQVLTGSFKDVKNDRWVRVFNLVMYAYKQFAETKSEGSDNPIVDTILKVIDLDSIMKNDEPKSEI